ncbi:MAG: hypothetical protein ABSF21_00300 [Dehalococcoidia bacterium]|jgi:hypothetical protein
MATKTSKKRYNLSGGLKLHDARRILGIPIIAHTGRVNMYARCMGGKLQSANSLSDAQKTIQSNISACGGVAGGKARTWTRKDGKKMTARKK